MKNSKNITLGIILIIIGVILGGNALNLFDINLFFKGWWTLFLIIPSIVGLLSDKENDKKANAIVLIVGILLLLACQNIINFEIVWKLLLPIIIIIIGLSLIFKNTFNKDISKKIEKLNKKTKSDEGYFSTFSSQDVKLDDEEFNGTTLNAVFGGITLDLRKSKIKEDVVINASAIFGGIDIFLPEDVIVKVKSNSIFGGVSNKKDTKNKKDSKTVYINANCVFGGVEIK